MGSNLADLDQRDVARVRAELAEVIAARFAYPAFFDYSARAVRMRPLSAARRQEIARFVQLADLGGIEQMELTAPQVRRFLERLLRRFLEMEEDAASPAARRRVSLARVEVPGVASEMQRGLVAFAAGAAEVVRGYGLPRPRVSWQGVDPARRALDPVRAEQSARLIQAALLPRRDPALGQPYDPDEAGALGEDAPGSALAAANAAPAPMPPPPVGAPAPWYVGDAASADALAARQWPTEPTPAVNALGWRAPGSPADSGDLFEPRDEMRDGGARAVPAAASGDGRDAPMTDAGGQEQAATVAPAAWAALLRDLGGRAHALAAQSGAASARSPFLGLDGGAQSGIFGPLPENPFSEPLTGPLAAVGNGHNGHNGRNGHSAGAAEEDGIRGLPPALIQVYSEYLRALRPGAGTPGDAPAAAPHEGLLEAQPSSAAAPYAAGLRAATPPAPAHGTPLSPAMPDERAREWSTAPPVPATPTSAPLSGNDQLIFAQLRNQLDAYLRVMALAAGIPAAAGEPEHVVEALRRVGRLSAGDERLAGQILAITGRVLAGGAATPDDYRQAFMLYLLFHRGQVGV